MHIALSQLSLVALIGPSGSGKSTFSSKHFLPTEVLSSDVCRSLVSDDENNQAVTNEAFDLLHYIGAKRLTLGKLVVVDATNVQPEARKPLVELARQFHVVPVAIVFNVPERICHERNANRSDRAFGPHVIRNQVTQLKRSLRGLKREGFRYVFELNSIEEVDSVTIERVPLWTDKRTEHGPFDIIGDVHGCCDELEELLTQLGYRVETTVDGPLGGPIYAHPDGRKAFFVGDLVDRGPRIVDTLRLVRNMASFGSALCVPGNHDVKLLKKLQGKQVQITHGLAQTLAELEGLCTTEELRRTVESEIANFLDSLVGHYVLDDGKLVVAHAGMKAEYQGRASARVRDFALYGETTGETDEFGLPIRYNWAAEYRGQAMVVYGHTPVPEPEWLNRTINIDTGCVFGGKLTALRYSERELVSVKAARTYCEPARPFLPVEMQAEKLSAQHAYDEVLDAEDVIGKRIVSTRLSANVTIREENAVAALEVMSRFAANPKWLIYLPPTMSPCETSQLDSLLEHPAEAFAYYRNEGVPKVVCEEKHMGSRAVVIVCQSQSVAQERFGITTGESGIVLTRTGRRFFSDDQLEAQFTERLRSALSAAGFWDELKTGWTCLDCELMPWSAKAQELLRTQYAAVGAAARVAVPAAATALALATQRLEGDDQLAARAATERLQHRQQSVQQYVAAYRQYCWNVTSLDDLKLAPFHLLATEGRVHVDQNHVWHMETLAKVCQADPGFLLATPYRAIDLLNPQSEAQGIDWWLELTSRGGEGMVVKPLDYVVRGKRGLVQPAVKCRGPEYLRIIYGPEYLLPENLRRLRSRGLAAKRSLALREFALGVEALERFVRHEPLRRVHECVFGVLALESEPVDPRL
jgi:protein phosphatase